MTPPEVKGILLLLGFKDVPYIPLSLNWRMKKGTCDVYMYLDGSYFVGRKTDNTCQSRTGEELIKYLEGL